ncbi:MAG: hypothetical protein U0457_10020 [Candidatus Sericytochromatia bacterium]
MKKKLLSSILFSISLCFFSLHVNAEEIFKKVASFEGGIIRTVKKSPSGSLFALGEKGFFISKNNGKNWEKLSNDSFYKIAIDSKGKIILAQENNLIEFDEKNNSFKEFERNIYESSNGSYYGESFTDIEFDKDDNLFCINNHNTDGLINSYLLIFKKDTNEIQNVEISKDTIEKIIFSKDKIFILNNKSEENNSSILTDTITYSDDKGKTWKNISIPEQNEDEYGNFSLTIDNDNNMYFCKESYIYGSFDLGKTWKKLKKIEGEDYYKKIFVVDNKLFFSSETSKEYSEDNGKTWKKLNFNNESTILDIKNIDNKLFLATTDGINIEENGKFIFSNSGLENDEIKEIGEENKKLYALTTSGNKYLEDTPNNFKKFKAKPDNKYYNNSTKGNFELSDFFAVGGTPFFSFNKKNILNFYSKNNDSNINNYKNINNEYFIANYSGLYKVNDKNNIKTIFTKELEKNINFIITKGTYKGYFNSIVQNNKNKILFLNKNNYNNSNILYYSNNDGKSWDIYKNKNIKILFSLSNGDLICNHSPDNSIISYSKDNAKTWKKINNINNIYKSLNSDDIYTYKTTEKLNFLEKINLNSNKNEIIKLPNKISLDTYGYDNKEDETKNIIITKDKIYIFDYSSKTLYYYNKSKKWEKIVLKNIKNQERLNITSNNNDLIISQLNNISILGNNSKKLEKIKNNFSQNLEIISINDKTYFLDTNENYIKKLYSLNKKNGLDLELEFTKNFSLENNNIEILSNGNILFNSDKGIVLYNKKAINNKFTLLNEGINIRISDIEIKNKQVITCSEQGEFKNNCFLYDSKLKKWSKIAKENVNSDEIYNLDEHGEKIINSDVQKNSLGHLFRIYNNLFQRSTDNGKTWINIYGEEKVKSFIISKNNGILLKQGNEFYIYSSDLAKNWGNLKGVNGSILGITKLNDEIFYSTNSNGLYKSEDGGRSWNNIGFYGVNISNLKITKDNRLIFMALNSVFISNEKQDRFFSLDKIDNAEITSFELDEAGYIYLGTDRRGVFISDKSIYK